MLHSREVNIIINDTNVQASLIFTHEHGDTAPEQFKLLMLHTLDGDDCSEMINTLEDNLIDQLIALKPNYYN